jgi:hypothetical protein
MKFEKVPFINLFKTYNDLSRGSEIISVQALVLGSESKLKSHNSII